MNQVDRDMTAPLNDEMGNFQQSIWTIHWDSMTHEISRHVGLFVALRILNYYCNVHFSLETGVWKNMWKNNGCKKLDNDEILQDRKKHEKKYSQLWHPPNDFHMQSPSPFCIIAPHELLPRTWWTHHARGPPAVQEDQLSNILWKKGKTQATKWTSHDLPVWIDGWLQSISPRFLVVSVNMAAPNDFLSMAVSISPWLTHPIASWKLCMVRDKIRRKPWSFGWSVWGVAAAVPPVTDSLFAWKKWPVEAKATNGKLSWNYVL